MLTIENIPNNNIYFFPRLTEKYNQLSDLYVQCTDTNKAIELYETCELIEYYLKQSIKSEPLTKAQISFINDLLN